MEWLAVIVYVLSGAFFIAGLMHAAKRRPIDIDTSDWSDGDE